jgi:hypothetical protein
MAIISFINGNINKMLNYDLEAYLNEIGVISNEGLSTLEEILDPRYATLAKGYFNDPRDENGGVPY